MTMTMVADRCWVQARGVAEAAAGSCQGGATTMRPTRIAVRFAWLRRAHSSSGTSTAADRQQTIAERLLAAPRLRRRGVWLSEEHAPAVGGFVVVDGVGFELVQLRVEAARRIRASAASGTGPPAEVQRRDSQPKMSLTRSKKGFSLGVLPIEVVLLLRQRLRQLFEQVLLFLGELGRDGDAGDHVQVAVSAARDVRHALAAQLEARACLRAGGDVQILAPVERRDLDRCRRARASGS